MFLYPTNVLSAGPRRRPTVDHYKGAVPPHNETERMEAFTGIGLDNAPHNPLTARLAHVLAKLLQVCPTTVHIMSFLPVRVPDQ